jgi:hypothetical protein
VAIVMVVSWCRAPIVLLVLAARAHHHEPGNHWSARKAGAFDRNRQNPFAAKNKLRQIKMNFRSAAAEAQSHAIR